MARHNYSLISTLPCLLSRLIYRFDVISSVTTEILSTPVDVYNIEVDDTHSYFSTVFGANCDDITTEQEGRDNDPDAYDAAWNLFNSGARQRLQPQGKIVCIQTRWSKADLIGRLTRAHQQDPRADKYENIVFPALDDSDQSTFPEFWSTEELVATRANLLKNTPHFWYGPYMQNPTSSEGSMIPVTAWRKWDKYKRIPGTIDEVEFTPPECHYTVMVMDTAETENKRSNPTACTVFGIFEHKDSQTGRIDNHICLLHSYAEKLEFHRLKKKAKEWIAQWKPDKIIVEAKSTGPALRSELNEAGIPTSPIRPKPGEDKRSRLASVSDVFHSGKVWYIPTAANNETVTQVADFPNGELDDLVDCVSYTVRDFRNGGMVSTNNDKAMEDGDSTTVTDRAYY